MFQSLMKHHKYLGKAKIIESLNTTLEIHKKVNIDIPIRTKEDVLPTPIIPKKYDTKKEYINVLIKKGWKKRDIIGQAKKTAKRRKLTHNQAIELYKKQLKHELNIINKLGFMDYFLIVHELINWSRKHGILVGPGRGTAASSLFCYLLGITSIDPILYDLMFERFISEYKVTYPDIDMDFDWHRRGEIFGWMEKRFGEKSFAHIGAYGVMKGKQVIRDVSRVFDVSYTTVNGITKYVIQRTGGDERKSMTILDSFNTFDVMKKFDKQYPNVKKHAIRLEGITRNASIHPCGIIVSDQILTDIIPIETRNKTRTTSITGKECEKLGLLKIDILGLKTLSVIYKAVRLIKDDIDLEKIDLENKEILKEFTDTNFTGVFQYDSLSMRNSVGGFKFKSFDDITIWNASNRPGVQRSGIALQFRLRRAGVRKIPKIHPIYDRITKNTAGCVIYQEQISKIFSEMAGYTLADSDQIRVAIAKSHGKDVLNQYRIGFIEGCIKKGMEKSKAKKLFDQIVYFGCLSGRTVVYHKNSSITIKNMYAKDDVKDIASNIDGKVAMNEVINVYYSGKKELYKVVTITGKFCESTLDHEYLTLDGWKKLADIDKSELIQIADDVFGKLLFEKIDKIEYIGYEDTYDIAMKAPYNNYIVNNGIIVHNSYCFPNSHAAAYSVISVWCMWLKYYYPLEFMTALLSEENDATKIHGYIRECKRLHIKVIHPDIDKSKDGFAIYDENTIISGFTDIKGIGEKASAAIVEMQPFNDFYDFVDKVNRRTVNKRVIKALVLSGAMDVWCCNKKKFSENLDNMLDAKTKDKRDFYLSELKKWNRMEDWSDGEKAKIVKSVFSLPSDKHPIEYYKKFLKEQFPHIKLTPTKTASYDEINLLMWIAGEIIDTKLNQIGDYDKGKATKEEIEKRRLKLEPHGSRYANFDIEDSSGFKKFTVRPIIYRKVKEIIDKGNGTIVLAKCRVQARSSYIIYVDDMIDLDELKETGFKTHMQKSMSAKHHPCHNGRLLRKIKKEGKVDVILRDLKFYKTKYGMMAFTLLEDGEVNALEAASFNNVIKGRMRNMVKYYKERKPFVAMLKKETDKEGKSRYLITKMSIPKE